MADSISSLFDLSGKVALVTGGGSGLGREFCGALAEFGADIACCDLYGDRAEETCRMIGRHGHRTLAMETDVSDYDQVKSGFKKVEETFGKLDILVNNAGIAAELVPFDQVEIDNWHKVIGVDLNGVFYCMKEGIGLMMRWQKGSVINIASIMGIGAADLTISPGAPYVAAKHAVIGLTRQGAAEYSRHHIRVNCIAPGYFPWTRIAESIVGYRQTENEAREYVRHLILRTPMGRTGEPGELKGLVVYLASDASSFTTGQVIACDGGWTCV